MIFKDKVCVITGAANGIGKCILYEFIKRGAKVAFIDYDKASGEKIAQGLENSRAECFFYHGDIAEYDALTDFTDKVIDRFGGIDFLINNACLSKKGILSGCSYEDFNYVLKVGITAPYMLTKLFLNHFNKGASIVNISSTRAYMSQKDTESYSAAKGGISALTHALAISLAGKVRVNSISPGWIDTSDNPEHSDADREQHPSKRVGTPYDIARAVIFLCDEESGFITGQNITIDGGMTKLMIYSDDDGWQYKT